MVNEFRELDAVTTANKNVNPNKIIGLQYETHRVLVGLKDIKKLFEINKDRRDIRHSQVAKLFQVLEENKNFAGVFLVNRVIRAGESHLKMVDCNHRFEALIEFFTRYPEMRVWVELHIFDNLTLEQERVEFYNSNNHINQTTSDYVKLYRDDLNIWKVIDNDSDFPVKVLHKADNTHYALHTIFFPYLTRSIVDGNGGYTQGVPYKGGYDGSAMDFINVIRGWNKQKNLLNDNGEEAFNTMKAFLKDFVASYGAYTKRNRYWQPPIYYPIFRIWWENKSSISFADMRKRMEKLNSATGQERVKYWAGMGAPRGNCERSVVDFLTEINKGASKNLLYITTKDRDDPITGVKGAIRKEYGRA